MKLIKPSVLLIDEPDPLKRIEIAGRTCYKSEDKITEDSAARFVGNCIERAHFAMLEHARVTYEVKGIEGVPSGIINMPAVGYTAKSTEAGEIIHYITLSVSHVMKYHYTDELPTNVVDLLVRMFYITFMTQYGGAVTESEQPAGECSAVLANNTTLSVKILTNIKEQILGYDQADDNIHNYYTFKFVCDRGVSHELVRHRASFAQESTRYCNYSKDKHGKEIVYVEPADYADWDDSAKKAFERLLEDAEYTYMNLINRHGKTPQQARAVLPNALKTEVVITMPVWQWIHFFNLRSIGTTGAPHPDMKVVADMALIIFKKLQGIEDEVPEAESVTEPETAVDIETVNEDVAPEESDSSVSDEVTEK